MPIYDRIFAALYDKSLAATEAAGLADRRRDLIAEASGSVIEIGAGTGLNLYYFGDGIERLVLTEPSAAMAAKLRDRLAEAGREAEVVEAGAEKLPFAEGEFDCVVATLVLCTVPDPVASLAEIRRVLKPDGKLLLLEHVRSDDPTSAKWQDRLETPWRLFANGCYCNRETETLVTEAGFRFDEIEHGTVNKAPGLVKPLIQGRAISV